MAFPTPNELRHVPLSAEQETELKGFLSVELEQAEADRVGLIDRLKREIQLYEAVPDEASKAWPWNNASNLVVPIIGSMCDTIFPRIYSTIFGVDPLITVEEKDPDWADNAKAYQEFFDLIQKAELDLPRISESWFLEAIIHGTSVVKIVWDRIEQSVKTYDSDGEITKEKKRMTKDGPALYRVPLADFFIPMYAKSIKDAPWVAHRIRTYWGRLEQLERSGVYKNLGEIMYSSEFRSDEYTRKREELEDNTPSYQEEYELFEVWLEYDYDGDGADENLIVTYHRPTNTILRVQFNPYWHMRKPFRELIYWPRHDRFYGIGIAAMVAPMQDEISTIHNQNIDNRTIANTRMWEVVAGSTADRNFDGVAPGRTIKVDRLGEEIQPIQLGDVYTSFMETENIALRYAQQRTGVSDFLTGVDSGAGSGGRETATTTMVRMQEARTRFNWSMDSVRYALTDIAELTTSLLQQFADENSMNRYLAPENAILVQEFLSLPEEDVRSKATLKVTASTASLNKEAEKQNLIALVQMLQQQAMNFEMPFVQMILSPQVPPEMKEYAMDKLNGMHILFKRILQIFDSRNTDEILGNLRTLEETLAPAGPALGQPVPGPAPAGPGAMQQPGMGVPPGGMGGGIPGGSQPPV